MKKLLFSGMEFLFIGKSFKRSWGQTQFLPSIPGTFYDLRKLLSLVGRNSDRRKQWELTILVLYTCVYQRRKLNGLRLTGGAVVMDKTKLLPLKPEHIDQVLEIERVSFPTPWSRESFLGELLQNSL